MHRTATRQDFLQLSPDQQAAHAQVLQVCQKNRLSCRCEVIDNREFSITTAPGLSSAKYWIDKFDIDPDHLT